MSETNIQELLAKIGGVNDLLLDHPTTKAILQGIQQGALSMEEGVASLAAAIEEEGLMGQMKEAAQEVEQLAPGFELTPEALEQAGRPILTQTSTGIPQLNPLYEAAIAEQAFLDGDAPSLRHGPMAPGSTPAVPVATDAMDPVVVGYMLKEASGRVARQLEVARETHAALLTSELERIEEEAEQRGEDPTHALELKKAELPAPTGVPGYLAGQAPHRLEVVPPTLAQLEALTSSERQEFAYKAISTTQGRVTLQRPILKQVHQALLRKGLSGVEPGFLQDAEIKATWTMQVFGAADIADRFSFPQVAVGVLTRDLLKGFEESGLSRTEEYILDVKPINGVSERIFGWTAFLEKRHR